MSSYYAYQNALNDYDNRLRDYNNQKASLLYQFSPKEIARGLTEEVAPLVMAETGLHGGKAAMNNLRGYLADKAKGAARQGRQMLEDRVAGMEDQAAEGLQAARQQAGDVINQGVDRAAEIATRATRALRAGVGRAGDAVAEARTGASEAMERAQSGFGEFRLAANRKMTQTSTDGRQWLTDVNRQNEYDRVTSNALRRQGQDELADRFNPMRRGIRTIPERAEPEAPLGGEEPVDVGAELQARAGQVAEGRAVFNRVRGRYLQRNAERQAAERAERPRDIGDVAQDRIPVESRSPIADQLGQSETDIDSQIAGASGSRLRMLNATKARISRAQSLARKQPEDPEDVGNDLLPTRPQLVEDTRLTRLGTLNNIRQNALDEATRIRGQGDLAAQLGRLRNEPEGYRNVDIDARAARAQDLADRTQDEIDAVNNEPNPNDLTEQAYHDGIDDARLGVDRSANYTDTMSDAYNAGAADMKNYQSAVNAHEALAKANIAETEGGIDATEGGIEGAIEGAGEASGLETGGIGFLVAGAVALGSELAAKLTDKPPAPTPAPPVLARFSGSQGLL